MPIYMRNPLAASSGVRGIKMKEKAPLLPVKRLSTIAAVLLPPAPTNALYILKDTISTLPVISLFDGQVGKVNSTQLNDKTLQVIAASFFVVKSMGIICILNKRQNTFLRHSSSGFIGNNDFPNPSSTKNNNTDHQTCPG